jgi:hypothetical protein
MTATQDATAIKTTMLHVLQFFVRALKRGIAEVPSSAGGISRDAIRRLPREPIWSILTTPELKKDSSKEG